MLDLVDLVVAGAPVLLDLVDLPLHLIHIPLEHGDRLFKLLDLPPPA